MSRTYSLTGLSDLARSYRIAASKMAAGEARAARRTGVTIVAQQSRAIAQVVNLRIRTIKDSIKTVRQPTASEPKVVFEVRQKGIPLRDFLGSRVTIHGLSVQPMKGGPRSVLKAGFAVGKFGGGFFGRASRSGTRYGSPHVGRTPIVKLYGPSVLSQYVKDGIQQAGIDTWNVRLPIELERETDYALKQAGLL